MVENNLSNSEIKKYEVIKYKNIGNKLFTIQYNNELNSSTNNNSTLSRKRGRPKESDDQREHTKFNKDNIEKKINGIIIKSTQLFIDDNFEDQNEKLKLLSSKETANLKTNMDKKVKDILLNISTKCNENHNKNLISKYDTPKLKEIYELPMYKIIQHISKKEKIGILKGLEEKYLSLKNEKLKNEDENYKQCFNKHEVNYLNKLIDDYENTQVNTINSISSFDNFDLNFIVNNNAYMVESDQFSSELIDSNNLNDSYLFQIIQCNSSNEEMVEAVSFSECL